MSAPRQPERGGGGPRRARVLAPAGFTLLEVLVSLAIFAMGFVVLMSAYLNILNGYAGISRSREADEDVKFARAALLAEPDLQKAQDGDEFDSTGERHVKWTSTIAPSDTIPDLYTVTFECDITSPQQSDPDKVIETFTVLRPTWATDTAARNKLLQDVKDRIADLQGKQPNGFQPAPPNTGNGGGAGRGGRGGNGGGGNGRGGRGGRGGGNGNGGGRRGGGNGGNGGNFNGGNFNGGPGFQQGGNFNGGQNGQGGGRRGGGGAGGGGGFRGGGRQGGGG